MATISIDELRSNFESESDETYILIRKIDYVYEWRPDELYALTCWFNAYTQFKHLQTFKESIEKSRLNVQNWIDGLVNTLSDDFPFSIFLSDEFQEITPFLSTELINKFIKLLDTWPVLEYDYIVYASCVTSFNSFEENEYGIFEKSVKVWFDKNKHEMENLFWKTEDHSLQRLFSYAIEFNL